LKRLQSIGMNSSDLEENNDLRKFLIRENVTKDLGNPVLNLYCSYR
jgi:hypothetical protein